MLMIKKKKIKIDDKQIKKIRIKSIIKQKKNEKNRKN